MQGTTNILKLWSTAKQFKLFYRIVYIGIKFHKMQWDITIYTRNIIML